MPWLRFANAMVTLRKCHGYASQVPCSRLLSAMFTLPKCHVYNLQVMVFWLTNKLCKGSQNVKKGAFLPRFCINIQNDRKIAYKALFFHSVQNYS